MVVRQSEVVRKMMKDLRVDVPVEREDRPGVPIRDSGKWTVERIHVSKSHMELEQAKNACHGIRRGRTTPGHYTALRWGKYGDVVMSDTQDEINDLYDIFAHATGHVLVNGLGLGVVVEGLCQLPHVTHITIIENSKDVLALVAGHYRTKFGDRIEIIHADAFTWKPPRGIRYGAVWHDIWPSICSDHLPEMRKLHRKYGRRTEWQGSWCRAEMERQP
jgi:hypothetical protein